MTWQHALAAAVAGLLTFVDLDRTFYVPTGAAKKLWLWTWWWIFVVGNAGLAAGLYGLVNEAESLQDIDTWWRGLLTGAAYPALVRSKLTTLRLDGSSVPFGLEALYEAVRDVIYKRINRIAKDARYAETTRLASAKTIEDLTTQIRLSINQDALLSAEEKRDAKGWVLEVLQDPSASEDEKRASLADAILSSQFHAR